jgi:hypothetical protein
MAVEACTTMNQNGARIRQASASCVQDRIEEHPRCRHPDRPVQCNMRPLEAFQGVAAELFQRIHKPCDRQQAALAHETQNASVPDRRCVAQAALTSRSSVAAPR